MKDGASQDAPLLMYDNVVSERIEKSVEGDGIISESEIFENPDNGIYSEENKVNNRNELSEEPGKVINCFGNLNGLEFFAFNIEDERL